MGKGCKTKRNESVCLMSTKRHSMGFSSSHSRTHFSPRQINISRHISHERPCSCRGQGGEERHSNTALGLCEV